MAVYAYGEASRLLDRALQVQEVLASYDKVRRCDLLLSLGEALLPAGEPQRVMDVVAPEAFTLAEAVSDRARASLACRMALDAIIRYGGTPMAGTSEYLQWAQRADRYAEVGTTDRIYADIRLVSVRWGEGKLTEARNLALHAMELARELKNPEALYRAARGLITSPRPPEHEEERLQLVTEMNWHDHVGVTAGTLGSWLTWGGHVLLDQGDRTGAEAMWEQLGQLAERTNVAGQLIGSAAARPRLAYLDGHLDEAVSGANDILRTAEELGAPFMGHVNAWVISWQPLLHMGRGEEALAALSADELAGVEYPEGGEVRKALIQAHLGQTSEARDALQDLVADQRVGFEDENLNASALVVLLELATMVGDRELCSVLTQRLAPAANLSTAMAATCPARHLGAAAALLDEPDKARSYYHQALEAAGKIRFRPEIALTRLQLCELLLEHYPDERAEALDHLEFAIGEFQDMKMWPSLECALSRRYT